MSKNDYRIILWRNTIQLFHEYKRPNFVGPFKAAQLRYVVDRPFLTLKGDEKRPDIVASGESGWLVLELTTNDKSKESKLDSYKMIDPRYLSSYGLVPHKNEPDIICSRLSCVNDGPFCQILVKDFFSPITLVPEMRNQEIRRGLIEIVMQIFEPNSNGKTTIQMVDEGLERLSDIVGVTEKRSLLVKIDTEMDILIRNHLSGYLEFKDNTYKATEKFKQHHKTFGFVSLRLKEWAGPTPQTTIGDERWQ